MELKVNLIQSRYLVKIERGVLQNVGEYIPQTGKTCVITDENVAKHYLDTLMAQIENGYSIVVAPGEQSKSIAVYEQIQKKLIELDFNRNDVIIALGGGVIGDLAGFVASTYKRGIRYVSIPTSTLACVDSCIGGKVAVNLDEYKNMVGTFHHPSLVLIDPNVTNTLDKRHFYSGLAEAVKMGVIAEPELLDIFEKEEIEKQLERIFYLSLKGKRRVIEIDEKEENLRKILNYGHTIGHGLESYYHLDELNHGEAVMLGMIMMMENEELKQRLITIAKKCNLKTEVEFDVDAVCAFIVKDKKAEKDGIGFVVVNQLQRPELKVYKLDEIKTLLEK